MKRHRAAERILLAGACSVLVPQLFAELPAVPEEIASRSRSAEIAEDATVDLLGILVLFDHLFMKPATATSPDYLERVSEPSSKSYPDYLEYKQGRISRVELVRRLPHIAMVGDSLSRNFYISSPASMLWRARTERQRDWFLDTDPSPRSVSSLYETLKRTTPLVATEYSSAGGLVAPSQTTEGFSRRLARTHNLRGQITKITRAERFPDVVLIWIGHNNTDWVKGLPAAERKRPTKRLRQIAQQFGINYMAEVQMLVDRAKIQKHRVALVVFGLADFKTFFESRKKAAALHARDPALYPYYEASCRYFESLQPANQDGTIQLGLMMNEELKKMVATLNRKLKDDAGVRLEYSDALSKIDLSDLKRLHRMDAWHPSIIGHNLLAERAFKAITPSLHFVGIETKRHSSAPDHLAQAQGR
jgi:lysophospholipase L1-like esterase